MARGGKRTGARRGVGVGLGVGEDARRSGSSACAPPRVPVDARGRESRSPRTRPWTPWREARSPRSMQRDDADEARAPRASRERSGSSRAYRRAPWIGARGFFADPRVERGARACAALARPRRVGGRRWRATSSGRRRGKFLRERLVFRPNVDTPKMTFQTHSVESLTLSSIPFRAGGADSFRQRAKPQGSNCLCFFSCLVSEDSRAVTPTLTRERRSNFPDSSATTVLLVHKGDRRRELSAKPSLGRPATPSHPTRTTHRFLVASVSRNTFAGARRDLPSTSRARVDRALDTRDARSTLVIAPSPSRWGVVTSDDARIDRPASPRHPG